MANSPTVFPDLKLPPTAGIGIFGHYGNENLGDEAIIQAVIEQTRRRLPEARIVGFSINPAETSERHGIPAFPIRHGSKDRRPSRTVPVQRRPTQQPGSVAAAGDSGLKARLKKIPGIGALISLLGTSLRGGRKYVGELGFLWKAYRSLSDIDLLMVTGSNQFLDNFGGPWGFPYTLAKWAWLARLSGTRLVFVSVGAGPIAESLSFRLIRMALGAASYLSLRDAPSLELLESHGWKESAQIYPDLAFSLAGSLPNADKPAVNSTVVVGINPMPVYDSRYWHQSDDGLYQNYVRAVAEFSLDRMQAGERIILWSTQPRDELVIDDILDSMDKSSDAPIDRLAISRKPRTVAALVAVLGELDVAVATRFHGVVLSLWAGLPTMAIYYHRKQRDLLCDFGLEEHSMAFECVSAGQLNSSYASLQARHESIDAAIRGQVHDYQRQLDQQYDGLFGVHA